MGSAKPASAIAARLNLKPHPEGGFYSETFRDSSVVLRKEQLPSRCDAEVALKNTSKPKKSNSFLDKVDRPISTAIYFLLPSGSVSRLHRIPSAETWHFYMGEPLTVFELTDDGVIKLTVLGLDIEASQRPQYTVPPNVWFGSFPTKDVESFSSDGSSITLAPERDPEKHYSLVGCTCAPAFQFEDFELATTSAMIHLAPHAEPFIRYLTPSG